MHNSTREVKPSSSTKGSTREIPESMTLSAPGSLEKQASAPSQVVVEKVLAARISSTRLQPPSSKTDSEVELIRSSWRALLAGDGTAAQMPLLRFVEQYYKRLFRLFPDSRGVFKTRDTQSKSLSLLLSIIINVADEPELEMNAKKKKLEMMYKEYGMNSLLAVIAGRVLIQSLQAFLEASNKFQASVKDAWVKCYTSIADQLLFREKDSISQRKMIELIDQLDVGDQEWMMNVSRDEELKPVTKGKNWRYKLVALNKRMVSGPSIGKKLKHTLTSTSDLEGGLSATSIEISATSVEISGSDDEALPTRAKMSDGKLRRRSTQSLNGDYHSKFTLGSENDNNTRQVTRSYSSLKSGKDSTVTPRRGRSSNSQLRKPTFRGGISSASDGTLCLGIVELKE
ncbi:hypothetical protein SARC_12917 [Sphaeroforma arctica JP610]|uniref:Globin domain-containing protein n=1 Tax=Sphaeroforma arctica JP610 TaxID=667725 RepID=A0A0L0FDI4_9EUKA|nr:hypothetical protein SARC_12917 [Sphaeroforma arctica JP610]KNC74541.1 hypothetical protein SARC_12917 [Sphaeroforma arctica JP610]|eukprot:XP_014148443.1 hypothetical protein SARC_12917 [Sphaeroforma arctica JP610]